MMESSTGLFVLYRDHVSALDITREKSTMNNQAVTIGMELAEEALLPLRKTLGSSGYDLHAYEHAYIPVSETALIRTGIKLQIPFGYEGQIRSRSGLALKHGIIVLNSPGTIDSDYAEEIGVLLYNAGGTAFHVKKGDRIAQIVFAPVLHPHFALVDVVSTTDRGGGFGSTGV